MTFNIIIGLRLSVFLEPFQSFSLLVEMVVCGLAYHYASTSLEIKALANRDIVPREEVIVYHGTHYYDANVLRELSVEGSKDARRWEVPADTPIQSSGTKTQRAGRGREKGSESGEKVPLFLCNCSTCI
jgi:hypothetical protein